MNSPFDNGVKLKENNGRALAQLEYVSAIGSLMYAMHCTRPDISFVVSKLSRFTSNPGKDHWKAIERVLGYLKHTSGFGLFYNQFPSVLEGFFDASWITNLGDINPQVGGSSLLLVELFLWQARNKHVSLILPWSLSL